MVDSLKKGITYKYKESNSVSTLKIKNFLVLDDIDIDFSKVSILIGPQAEGKSLLAKMLYFFYEFFHTVREIRDREQTIKKMKFDFLRYFPKDTLKNNDFEIIFNKSEYSIAVKGNSDKINIVFNDKLNDFIVKNIEIINKNEKELREDPYRFFEKKSPQELSRDTFSFTDIYIPALRHRNTQIDDRFISRGNNFIEKIFDPIALQFKNFYNFAMRFLEPKKQRDKLNIKYYVNILKGYYKKIGDFEYIENSTGKDIPFDFTSSGQQEVFPILIFLRTFPALPLNLFIEEPEAHLFPQTQKDLLSEIISQVNLKGSNLIITTHSPYILSSFNNHIAAYDVFKTEDDFKIKEMKKILRKDRWLRFEDVRAYFIEKGRAKNIMDTENRMIDFGAIDKCSEGIVDEMNKILGVIHG